MSAFNPCPECGGSGWVRYMVEGEEEWAWSLCPECEGGDAFPPKEDEEGWRGCDRPAAMLSLNRLVSPRTTLQGEPDPSRGIRWGGRRPGDNQEGEDLIVLDQHGAHERILYEKLRENPEAAPVALEHPAVAMLPEYLATEAWSSEGELNRLGFLFEPFGADAVRVTAAPATAADPEAAFLAAVHALSGGEDLAKALACKGSTNFGESLSKEETSALLQEWTSCEFPDVCPHGRPIVKRVVLADLLREFGRL